MWQELQQSLAPALFQIIRRQWAAQLAQQAIPFFPAGWTEGAPRFPEIPDLSKRVQLQHTGGGARKRLLGPYLESGGSDHTNR